LRDIKASNDESPGYDQQRFTDKEMEVITTVGQYLSDFLDLDGQFCCLQGKDNKSSYIYFYRFENEEEQCRSDAFIHLTKDGFLSSAIALAGALRVMKEGKYEIASVADLCVYFDIMAENSPVYDYMFKEIRSICLETMEHEQMNDLLDKINEARSNNEKLH
jgi:hypothetical protein